MVIVLADRLLCQFLRVVVVLQLDSSGVGMMCQQWCFWTAVELKDAWVTISTSCTAVVLLAVL